MRILQQGAPHTSCCQSHVIILPLHTYVCGLFVVTQTLPHVIILRSLVVVRPSVVRLDRSSDTPATTPPAVLHVAALVARRRAAAARRRLG